MLIDAHYLVYYIEKIDDNKKFAVLFVVVISFIVHSRILRDTIQKFDDKYARLVH